MSSNSKKTSIVSILVLRIALICFVSNLILLLSLYFWLRYELAVKDQELARIRFHEVAEVLDLKGVDFLKLQLEQNHFSNLDMLLIQVVDSQGHVLIDKMPKRMSYFEKNDVNSALKKSFLNSGNNTIYPKVFGQETIEIYSDKIAGSTLIVGINTDASEDFVNLFGHNALLFMILIVLVISSISYVIIKRSIAPIHKLISTIKSVRAGRFEFTNSISSNNDEVAELSALFDEMIKEIAHLVKSLQSSLDSIAHDLRTPMMHLRLKISNLSKKIDHESLHTEELDELLEEALKIEELISQLLEISESTSSGHMLNKTEVSLLKTVEEVIDIYEYVLEEKHIVVQNSIDDTLIFADYGKLKRIIANLFDNAIKYSSNEKPTIIFSISFPSHKTAHFTISDNGCGISEKEFHRIWERLYRVDPSRSTPGVGLGLSLVKSLVEAHGWNIKVESQLGAGSKFIIEILLE